MVANYLSTELPAEMRVNDANHALAVEDQVARLAAALRLAAAVPTAIGGVVSQPVTLGSAGEPPFAPADGASIGPGVEGSALTESFIVSGQATYSPPGVGPAGGTTKGDSCTTSSTSLTCSGSSKVVWNFTSSAPGSYSVTTSGGPYYVNASVSGSTIAVTASSTAPLYLLVLGNNDTVSVTISGSNCVVHIEVVGNYDTVTFPASSWSGSRVSVYMVGNDDSVSTGALTLSSSHLTETFFGSDDTTTLGTTSASGNSAVNAYLNGFVPSNPSSMCPVDNLAASTDSVTTSGAQSGGTYNVTYNDTTTSSGTAPPSPWTGTYATPAQFACPFYAAVSLSQTQSGAGGASLVVHLKNTYTPQANVAFDQGAVVYAQSNGAPIVLVGPGVTYAGATLRLWVPEFLGSVGTEVGTGTAEISARLTAVRNLTLPASGFTLKAGSTVYANVTTAYAAAWTAYLTSYLNTTSLRGVATVTCAPSTSSACRGPFTLNGPLGTVTLAVPASAAGTLEIQVATYAVTLY